eukprot:749602-Hanusia_phi.AAC.1
MEKTTNENNGRGGGEGEKRGKSRRRGEAEWRRKEEEEEEGGVAERQPYKMQEQIIMFDFHMSGSHRGARIERRRPVVACRISEL